MRTPLLHVLLLLLALGAPAPAAAGTCAAPGPAPSEKATRRARAHYERGAASFAAGDYAAARTAFEAAHALVRLPDLLYNLAMVARKQGRPEDAARYLDQYVAACPDTAQAAGVRDERRAPERAAESAPERAPAVAARRPATAPIGAAMTASGAAPAAPAGRSTSTPRPAMVLLGAGTAVLTIGLGLGVGALVTREQLEAGPRFDRALDQRGRDLGAAAVALDVLGGVALAAGGVWCLVHYLRGHGGERRAAAPHATARGVALDF